MDCLLLLLFIIVIITIIKFHIFLFLDFISVFHLKLSHLRCCKLGDSRPYFHFCVHYHHPFRAEYHLITAKRGWKSGLPTSLADSQEGVLFITSGGTGSSRPLRLPLTLGEWGCPQYDRGGGASLHSPQAFYGTTLVGRWRSGSIRQGTMEVQAPSLGLTDTTESDVIIACQG